MKDELMGVAPESARPRGRAGRSESLGPFQLDELAADGDRWAKDRWNEYQEAVRGRHRLQWFRRLRARFGMVDERTDE